MSLQLVSLTDSQVDFIETLINSGRYIDVSEVLREGLRLLQHREFDFCNDLLTKQNTKKSDRVNNKLESFSPPPLAEDE
jgi:putative addiction module CopG family antidote